MTQNTADSVRDALADMIALATDAIEITDDDHERIDAALAVLASTLPLMTCRYCGRSIVNLNGRWIDPQATGDDRVWRETCDEHNTLVADHEPDWSIR